MKTTLDATNKPGRSARTTNIRTSVRAGDNPGQGPYGSIWSCKQVAEDQISKTFECREIT